MRPTPEQPLLQAGGPRHSQACDPKGVALSLVLGALEVGVCLAIGWGVKSAYYDAAQCSDAAATSCTFEAGTAAGDQHLPILSAASAPNQAACCSACVRFEGCIAATYIDVNTTSGGWLANCLMYSSDVFTPGDEVSRPGAALCTPPAATRLISEIAAWMDEVSPGPPRLPQRWTPSGTDAAADRHDHVIRMGRGRTSS